jgi:MoaE-MoaD fusion protein
MSRVLYFGPAREASGVDEEDLEGEKIQTVDQFWSVVIARHPRLAGLRASSRLAVDMVYAREDADIGAAAEIAIIPPVAGG